MSYSSKLKMPTIYLGIVRDVSLQERVSLILNIREILLAKKFYSSVVFLKRNIFHYTISIKENFVKAF